MQPHLNHRVAFIHHSGGAALHAALAARVGGQPAQEGKAPPPPLLVLPPSALKLHGHNAFSSRIQHVNSGPGGSCTLKRNRLSTSLLFTCTSRHCPAASPARPAIRLMPAECSRCRRTCSALWRPAAGVARQQVNSVESCLHTRVGELGSSHQLLSNPSVSYCAAR